MSRNGKSRSLIDLLKQKKAIVAIVLVLLIAAGCSNVVDSNDAQTGYSNSPQTTQSHQSASAASNGDDETDESDDEFADDGSSSSSAEESTSTDSDTSAKTSAPSNTTASVKNGIPAVLGANWESQSSGLYYTNDKEPAFSSKQKKSRKSFENYSSLDYLGRCGAATACIGLDIMPTGGRGSISEVKPTGWHTYEYDFINGGYLYNRCHLVAYSLAGENANERNLITGTRQMNEAMIMFENIVYTYVTGSGNHCLYRVTPIFLKSDLVARGVHMEALSVEDNGDRVKFNVYIPNKQDKVRIDYSTGESSLKAGVKSSAQSKSSASKSGTKSAKSAGSKNSGPRYSSKSGSSTSSSQTYVLNTSSKKFHYSDCSAVKRMADHNKSIVKMKRSAIIAQGYDPCGICHP